MSSSAAQDVTPIKKAINKMLNRIFIFQAEQFVLPPVPCLVLGTGSENRDEGFLEARLRLRFLQKTLVPPEKPVKSFVAVFRGAFQRGPGSPLFMGAGG